MRPNHLLLPLLLATNIATAGAATATPPQREVTDLRALWMTAIDSPDGSARGVLVSPEMRAIAASMKTTSPLLVEVTTLKVYTQEGCRRLQMTIHARDAVIGPSPQPHNQDLVYGFNYCRDGRPPRSLEVKP